MFVPVEFPDTDQQHEPPRHHDDDEAYYRSSPTYNSRTNSVISRHPAPSSHDRPEPLRPVILRMPNSPSRDGNANTHNRNVISRSELHSTAQGRVSVASGSSPQRQNLPQVPGVSSPPSVPRSASIPS